MKELGDGLLRAAACYKKLGRLIEARARLKRFSAWPYSMSRHYREMADRLADEIAAEEVKSTGSSTSTTGPRMR